ncbi:2-isopropylmalate synthase (plasmid) [Buchnera aphidicola (Mollitrichosiphum nigrofasciatum)]|uniref:2-isopropylmalate synthase n=1 Tax=Buchnera aphidicola TaxID=9 RepID=UPI0031B83965
MSRKIIIFDTTLRDGEQALQVSLNSREKLKIALSLEKLGVDIIEVGFPVSSPGDFNSVEKISNVIKESRICSLARCIKKDIDIAAQAMSNAKNFRIHIFLGTSNLHIYSKLRKNFSEIIEMAVSSIKYTLRYTNDIEFSCEDAGRTSPDNLCKIIEKVIQAGATTVNIPDTVGYTLPTEFSKIISDIRLRVPNIHKSVISVHCHDDLGLAVGNSISAIQAGAGQVEGTINGIGERAGNTALEEVILAIKTRKKILNVYTGIKHKELYNTSKTVSKLCNIMVPSNKAIVGSNAFSHSSGIHQDGILKNRKNYEIMNPETIGLKIVQFNLTSRSGRAAIKNRMQEMGYSESDYNIEKLYMDFIKLADIKGKVYDYDLEALAFIKLEKFMKLKKYFKLKNLNINFNTLGLSTVSIQLIAGKKLHTKKTKSFNGPLYTIYKTFKQLINFNISLKKFKLITKIKENKTITQVKTVVKYNNRFFNGISVNKNIIKASAKSLINILNDIWISKQIRIKFNKI